MNQATSRGLAGRLALVVAFSVTVFTLAGVVSWLLHAVAGLDGLLAFVYLRWAVVFSLVGTAVLARAARGRVAMPYVLATPVTPLLLTCESILVDIIVAQLRH